MHYSLWTAATLALSTGHANAVGLAPGPAACAGLTTALGSSKVKYPLSVEYAYARSDYWNEVQAIYMPSCVVLPETTLDVSTAMKEIRKTGTRFAIKAGGHNPNTFFSSVNNGVLIDVNSMTDKSYDAETTLGTYQPGGHYNDVYKYFAQYNRTVVGARLGGVGTGLGLGGGLSFLSGQYGLAVDSFRELEVVLPNGDIVTASPTENQDLFFADRGGGGNAYGIVTKYTIQTRPSGTFYAGNTIYPFNQQGKILEATKNFIRYNTDPRAAVIVTYENIGVVPGAGQLDLDQAILTFLVFDGSEAEYTAAGSPFKNFTAVPALFNSLGEKSYYPEVVNMPAPLTTEVSKGDNIFRVAVHRVDDDALEQHFAAWKQWCDTHKGDYVLSSLDFEPISQSLIAAGNAQNGGNAMQLKEEEGPFFWLNFLINSPQSLANSTYDNIQASFRDMVNSVPNAPGLPLFINDAAADQNPLQTFSTFHRLQEIKQKYDPDNFFGTHTGQWSFASE